MNILIFTQRTELPSSIAQLVAVSNAKKKIVKTIPKMEELEALLTSFGINSIYVDADFKPGDHDALQAINSLDEKAIRRRFVQTAELPKSVQLLPRLRAANTNSGAEAGIWFFIDKPGQILKTELLMAGATTVHPSLDQPSGVQTSAVDTVQDLRKLVTSGKKLFHEVSKGLK